MESPPRTIRVAELIYPPAQEVAPILHERLQRQHADAREEGREAAAPLPTADVIERLTEAAFWASLRREEGRSPKISLAYVPPEAAGNALTLERRLLLAPRGLTRLSPAVERPGIHLCVWGGEEELYVWGATRELPEKCLVLEVVEPGLVVAKYSRRETFGKFGNLAMFKGDTVKVVDENAARRPDCPELLATLTGLDGSSSSLMQANVLVQIALSMRAHQHGGTLLIVSGGEAWQQSVVSPMQYRVSPPFSHLRDVVRRRPEDGDTKSWMDDFRLAVEGMAGLTAVDGATVIDTEFDLLAFGIKIERAPGASTVREVVTMEPVVGNTPRVIGAAELGGTRHLSAAQFVQDQRDALALVASQDGRFTIFAWSHLEGRVHAQRIETLLL